MFGDYRLEPAMRRLSARGQVRELDARALAVLECLLRHAECVVPRATLISEAWPGAAAVFDSAVSKVIRRLRIALGDSPGHVLQTVYGEGYRLALPAVLLPAEPLEPPRPPVASHAPLPPPRTHRDWLGWLPWAIAALATLVAATLALMLLRAGT